MRRIGIVTINDYYNLGNRLQNYAMQCVLEKELKGCAITLEGYSAPHPRKNRFIPWLKEEMARLLSGKGTLAGKILPAHTVRWGRFENWTRKHIRRERYYECGKLPPELNNRFDVFIAGSDQIWNHTFSHYRKEDYFLEFASKDKRAAVAASFGVDEIPEELSRDYKSGLSGFRHISVREDAGKEIVQKMLGKDVPVLIDPVMMLTPKQWRRVAKEPEVDTTIPYVLKYYLGDGSKTNDIDAWASSNGMPIYVLMDEDSAELYRSGPGEFISLIDRASLIVTDSFHGVAFAILFSKPFIVYKRDEEMDEMSSRMDTVLKKFGLEGRWRHRLNEEEFLIYDHRAVEKKMIKERENFSNFLLGMMSDSFLGEKQENDFQ